MPDSHLMASNSPALLRAHHFLEHLNSLLSLIICLEHFPVRWLHRSRRRFRGRFRTKKAPAEAGAFERSNAGRSSVLRDHSGRAELPVRLRHDLAGLELDVAIARRVDDDHRGADDRAHRHQTEIEPHALIPGVTALESEREIVSD